MYTKQPIHQEGKSRSKALAGVSSSSRAYKNEHAHTSEINADCPCGSSSCFYMPGFVDLHVHLREPGNIEKETVLTGTKAAKTGGFSLICAMPNITPAPDCLENLKVELDIINKDAQMKVLPFGCITKGRAGKEPAEYEEMMPYVAGFSDDGSGIEDDEVMKECMTRIARLGGLLVAHCEKHNPSTHLHSDEAREVERNIALAKETGCRLHLCHISTKESVNLIRQAKKDGVDVSCETAPHYLMFDTEMLKEILSNDGVDGGAYKMNPPIGTSEDRQALIEGLKDGTIDVIATDHAPHTAEEKSKGFEKSLNGIVGMESSFPVMYTYFVKTGIISMERLIDLMSRNARKILRYEDDITIKADLTTEFTIDANSFESKGHSCPFNGMKVYGKILQ